LFYGKELVRRTRTNIVLKPGESWKATFKLTVDSGFDLERYQEDYFTENDFSFGFPFILSIVDEISQQSGIPLKLSGNEYTGPEPYDYGGADGLVKGYFNKITLAVA
jgi:hypothetical protein